MKVYNTGIEVKRANWRKFADFIENQLNHGGEKYLLDNRKDKEFTDLVCEASPGKSGVDWIMQTIIKYCGRFINFKREKDLFKMATYAYIAWLKCGFHLQDKHDEDTNVDGSSTMKTGEKEKELDAIDMIHRVYP